MRAYKNQNYEQALIETFLKFDELLRIEKIDSCLRQNDKLRIIFTDTIENLCEKEKKTLSQLIPGDEFPLDTIIDLTQREKMTPTDKVLTKVINSLPNSITSTTDDSPLRYRESSNCIRKNNEVQINIENNYSLSSNSSLLANEMGTTANILLIKNNYMYLANVGDSLAYMYKNGQAIILTQEHKSTVPSEHSRIIQSGAEIVHNRINGKLNLTRAIGKQLL